MHGFTPISILGATTSLVASPTLMYVVLRAKSRGEFWARPYVGLLLFEGLFLVAYMTYLSFAPDRLQQTPSTLDAVLGATHGIAALVVFIGFWALLPIASRAYARGRNLFAQHPLLSWSAIGMRAVAVLSGEAIFILHTVT